MVHPHRKGFTLIELILVIAILGLLAITALPKFLDVATNARIAVLRGVEAAVRAGLQVYYSNNVVNGGAGSYPATLDAASDAACSDANVCFTTVLTNGVSDGNWARSSATWYTFATHTCIYTPATGTFNCT